MNMKFYLTAVLLLVCVCFVTSQAPQNGTGRLQPPTPTRPPKDKTVSAAGVFARTLGQSGKIVIGLDENPGKDPNALTIEFDSVEELDGSGRKLSGGKKKHSFPTFANQNFTFTDAINTTYQNYSVTTFNFTATLKGIDATVNVQLMIFREDANITNGDEDAFIAEGNVKFNIEIENWPFCGNGSEVCSGNKVGQWLEFVITIKGNKPPKRDDNKRPKPGKNQTGKPNGGSQGGKPQNPQGGQGGSGRPGGQGRPSTGSPNGPPTNTGSRPPKPTGASTKPSGSSVGGPVSSRTQRKKGQFYDTGADSGVTLSTKVERDGQMEDMPTGYPKYEQRGNKESFVFRFQRFQNKVFYDPTVAAASTYGTTNGVKPLVPHLLSFIAPALLFAFKLLL